MIHHWNKLLGGYWGYIRWASLGIAGCPIWILLRLFNKPYRLGNFYVHTGLPHPNCLGPAENADSLGGGRPSSCHIFNLSKKCDEWIENAGVWWFWLKFPVSVENTHLRPLNGDLRGFFFLSSPHAPLQTSQKIHRIERVSAAKKITTFLLKASGGDIKGKHQWC